MSIVGRILARGVAVSALVFAVVALPADAQAPKPKAKKKAAATAPKADTAAQVSDTGNINWAAYQKSAREVPKDTIAMNAYQGYKQFELNCSRCHGEYAVGTSFAPALVVSLKEGGTIPDQATFVQTVCAGRKEKGMPSWCEAGMEMDKILSIYDYVKGRADGKIHVGRPAVKEDGR